MKSIAIGLAVFCVLLSSAAQIAMKRGMGAPSGADVGATYLHALTSPMVWLGLVLYGASAVLWLWVLSRLDVSRGNGKPARWISAMAVGAAKHNIRRRMHRVGIRCLMAIDTTGTLPFRLPGGLINPVPRRSSGRRAFRVNR